jgi:hypothetical protein
MLMVSGDFLCLNQNKTKEQNWAALADDFRTWIQEAAQVPS